jgi:GNAT superfamily N-acetyltransferase
MSMSERPRVARLGNWWRYVRHHGLMAAGRIMINRYVYRSHRFVVTRAVLAGPPAADHAGDIVFRLATSSDLDHLDELERYGRGSTHRSHVKQDSDWLFVACHGDRIVATRRYSRALPPASRDGHGLMSRVMQLDPGQVWVADTFCLPEYRRQGLARLLGLFAKRFLASLGYKENFSAIAITNTPALRMSRHQGSQRVCYVSYFRLLFYERLRVSKEIPAQFEAADAEEPAAGGSSR